MGFESWVAAYKRRKWKWASRVANLPAGRPANAAAEWNAELSSVKGRLAGHPLTRWSDSINYILEHHDVSLPWLEAAEDNNLWNSLEEAYVCDSLR